MSDDNQETNNSNNNPFIIPDFVPDVFKPEVKRNSDIDFIRHKAIDLLAQICLANNQENYVDYYIGAKQRKKAWVDFDQFNLNLDNVKMILRDLAPYVLAKLEDIQTTDKIPELPEVIEELNETDHQEPDPDIDPDPVP